MERDDSRRITIFLGLCITMFFFRGLYGLFNVLMTGYAGSLQVPLATISSCAGMRSLANTISAAATPFLIHRFNAKRTILAGLAITLCAVLCMTFARNIACVYAGEFLVGIAGCMSYSLPCVALINGWFHKSQGKLLGIAMGVSSVGAAVFSYVGGQLLAVMSERRVYFILGVFVVLVCFCSAEFLIHVKEEPEEPGGAEPARRMGAGLFCLPHFWFCLLGMTCVGSVVINTLASPLLQSGGASVSAAAGEIGLVTLVGAVSGYFAGELKDRLGTPAMITFVIGSYILAVALAIAWLKTGNHVLLSVFLLMLGVSQPALVFSSYLSTMFDDQAVFAVGIMGSLQTAIQVLTLPVSGRLADITGSFIVTASLWLALLLCAFILFHCAVRFRKKAQSSLKPIQERKTL